MQLKFALALLVLALSALPAAAIAGDYANLRAIRQACGNDIQTLCAGVGRGQGRIAQCIMAHADAVSPGCANALEATKARLQSAGQSSTLYDTD
jgi:hypothetical protein